MSDDTSLSSENTFDVMDDESESSYERLTFEDDDMFHYKPHNHIQICNNTSLKGLTVFPYRTLNNPAPSVTQWRALGQYIGRHANIEYLNVCADGLAEDDEIASTEHLESFITRVANNRSLKEVLMEQYDFSRARLGLFHPLIIENNNLIKLQLHNCGFGHHDLQMLATAFSQRRNPSSIKNLVIGGRNIDDESVSVIVEICRYCPSIQHLDLSFSSLGNQCCVHLATLLENPNCKLKVICLAGNNRNIDDEGARILANSLIGKSKLKQLQLVSSLYSGEDSYGSNASITPIGWEYFLGILRHKSNIIATSSSNHTLEGLWDNSFGMPSDLPGDLLFCLQLNKEKDKKYVIREKIFHYHLNNEDLFAEDQEILPDVLGWIWKDYDACSYSDMDTRCTAFYRIIKSYPDLCNYPTYDRKMRNQLEAENTTINTENARLKAENSKLKAQNEELLRKIEQLTMEG